MPTYHAYNLMECTPNAMTFSGENLTPEEAVIAAYHYDNRDTIKSPLVDYVKNNLKNVRIDSGSVAIYYTYNDYCVAVAKS